MGDPVHHTKLVWTWLLHLYTERYYYKKINHFGLIYDLILAVILILFFEKKAIIFSELHSYLLHVQHPRHLHVTLEPSEGLSKLWIFQILMDLPSLIRDTIEY